MPPLLSGAVRTAFRVRLAYYRLLYPRCTFAPGVMVIGTLRIGRDTTVSVGADCRIRQRVIINGGGTVAVGEHTLLNGCWITAKERVEVGAWSLLSDCGISDTDHHNLSPRERHDRLGPRATAPVTLGRNVWVGVGATILKGTVVGDDSVVGAGAVVRGPVPEGVVVTGNPARVVKEFGPDERSVVLR